jgi:Holliday junction resolvase RusA-like endonuclease
MLEIYLLIPPSINHYYGTKKGGYSKFLKAEGIFFRQMALAVRNKLKASQIIDAKIKISIDWIFNNARANDIDNRIKPLFDAMQYASYFNDDKNIIEIGYIRKYIDKSHKASFCRILLEKSELTDIKFVMPEYLLQFI